MEQKNDRGNRRDFLKKGVTGLAGFAVLPTVLSGEASAQEEAKEIKKTKMVNRTLGKTGIKLPVVSMGAGACENPAVLEAALDAGMVHLDTANGYGRGRNEEMIGQVMKNRSWDSVVIATKVVGDNEDRRTGMFTEETKAEPFIEKFETSLQRLGTDCVDILYLHSLVTREATLFEPLLSALVKLKKEGKTKFIGVSTHGNEPEVIRAAIESKVYDVVLTAYNFRQPHVAEVEKAMAEAAKAGIGIVAMKTQAGVFWDRERQHQINMKAALKWTIQNKNVHTTIPGIATFDQLEENLSVMEDLKLTPAEEEDLKLGEKLGMNGLYCRQCGNCLAQCDKGVEVPTLMRSYMYAYGYRNLSMAKEAVESIDLSKVPCSNCGACKVDCTMGFDVKSKVEDIARIRNVPRDFLG
jgi:aryl-alcohol dehydrogenase-like predicted oxidoreductase